MIEAGLNRVVEKVCNKELKVKDLPNTYLLIHMMVELSTYFSYFLFFHVAPNKLEEIGITATKEFQLETAMVRFKILSTLWM